MSPIFFVSFKFLLILLDQEKVKGKWTFIFLTGSLYVIQLFIFVHSFKAKTNSDFWYILFASIFYYLFYKVKLYKHHYLSIVIILLLGLVIDLVTGNIQNELINSTLYVLAKFLREILSALYNVLAKYVMEKKFVSVYEFSFYIEIIFFLFYIIFAIFDYYFFGLFNYDEYFNKFNVKELFVIFGVIFTQLGINITTLFTDKNNSPCHNFIIFVFGQFAYYINFEGYAPLFIVCLIIILFFSLIFNEIIEINICGLSHNTKKNIVVRADSELLVKSEAIEEQNDNDNNSNDNNSNDNNENEA